MVSLSADREAYGPEEAAKWLAVSRFSSAILQLCQPIAVSAGQHMAWATMIQRVIWLSHTAVPERERASLVQGPLAPDGLFGPRFSEVPAHQQSVRENRSRFAAILTGSSRQQAGRKRGLGRSQRSRGPPPTPAPVQQQQQPQPPRTGRAAAPRTGKFRTLAPTFSFPIKEKSKDRSAERQYMVPKERYSSGHLRPTLVRSSRGGAIFFFFGAPDWPRARTHSHTLLTDSYATGSSVVPHPLWGWWRPRYGTRLRARL
ncbi:unnamed protein product [Gadus morhua 'NCC']